MINKLRLQLTVWFVCLFLLIYAADGVFALYFFDRGLSSTIRTSLQSMCSELVPEVSFAGGTASLREWNNAVQTRHVPLLVCVQIFDPQGKLKEQYGAAGISTLKEGTLRTTDPPISVYSFFERLSNGSYLQVQMPTREHDEALYKLALTKLVRGILIVIAIAICGWFYSGKAIQPVVRTLKTLRTFVDDAGHELNTPVTLIQTSVETMEAQLEDQGIKSDVIEIMKRASTRLKTLATNLLLLAKIENPEPPFRLVRIEPSEVLTDIVEELQPKAQARQVVLALEPLVSAPISADRDAISRLFSNLIENAIQYTAPGGKVTVSGSRQDAGTVINISDTGIGIPQECLPYIFDRFYRVDKARSRNEGGSGLGLSIVKAIVEAHRGTIKVDSQMGKGTTFSVYLPAV